MNARLVESALLRRSVEVDTPEGIFLVDYNGFGVGQLVSVNGQTVAPKRNWLWLVPRFDFTVGDRPAAVNVRLTPWLRFDFQLTVDGNPVYSERTWQVPAFYKSLLPWRAREVKPRPPALPLSSRFRRRMLQVGFALAIVGCIVGSVLGYFWQEAVLRITGGEIPWTPDEAFDAMLSIYRSIHPAIWVGGYAGTLLFIVGCFIIVRAKQLHPYWVLAFAVSFVGIVVLAKLPDGNRPRSVREVLAVLWRLLQRWKRLFILSMIVAVAVTVAWAHLLGS